MPDQTKPNPDMGLSRDQMRILSEVRKTVSASTKGGSLRKAVLDAQIKLTEAGIPPHLLKTPVLNTKSK